MKRKILLTALVAMCALTVFGFLSTSRAATETPDYKVVRKDGDVEIRDYAALQVATTPMTGSEMNDSFGQLFRFITGANDESKKIAMTAPVLIDSAKDKRTMSFIMPKQTVESGIPQPSGKEVTLGKIPPARFAVMRFAGGRTAKNETAAVEALKTWLEVQKIPARGEPMFAYYDPPWTPVFMRRNEVMIRIGKTKEPQSHSIPTASSWKGRVRLPQYHAVRGARDSRDPVERNPMENINPKGRNFYAN